MPKQKSTQPRRKELYRVKNWSEYDKALVERGSITFWLTEDFEKVWLASGEKQRGRQFEYSEQAILIMLTIKEVFHLTNRGVEGFVRSLFEMLKVKLAVPDHSTLSKRSKDLKVQLPKKTKGSLNIVMDSTGLKIHGEGEWKVRQHGVSKRRTWRKLHLGTNPDDGEIQAVLLTENSVVHPKNWTVRINYWTEEKGAQNGKNPKDIQRRVQGKSGLGTNQRNKKHGGSEPRVQLENRFALALEEPVSEQCVESI